MELAKLALIILSLCFFNLFHTIAIKCCKTKNQTLGCVLHSISPSFPANAGLIEVWRLSAKVANSDKSPGFSKPGPIFTYRIDTLQQVRVEPMEKGSLLRLAGTREKSGSCHPLKQ